MALEGDPAGTVVESPGDWPTEPEREYARRQAALADHHGVDVDSKTDETDVAGRVHYLEAGDPDGEPVVLLHGVSTTAATWLPMVSALSDEYHLIIPDRPGRGLSATPSYRGHDLRRFMVAYLVELFDGLGLERPHVVGNSLGGQQAFLLTIDHDRVDQLVLVGAPAGLSTELALPLRLQTVRGVNRLLFWLMTRGDPMDNARDAAEQFLVADRSAISEPFYAVLASSMSMPERQKSLRTLTTEQGSFGRMHSIFDIREEVAAIERPTAFLWGTEDSFWPPAVGEPVADRMADAQFYVLEGHGHMPWMEPGDETDRLVRSILDG